MKFLKSEIACFESNFKIAAQKHKELKTSRSRELLETFKKVKTFLMDPSTSKSQKIFLVEHLPLLYFQITKI